MTLTDLLGELSLLRPLFQGEARYALKHCQRDEVDLAMLYKFTKLRKLV